MNIIPSLLHLDNVVLNIDLISFNKDGKSGKVKISGSRTKIKIKGAKAKRKAFKVGMACSFKYPKGAKGKIEAKEVSCK